ncbi:MAG: LamG domain-containing protein, partial [Bacteroidetes bacterium]|nr:LamG domain-containing protein [Bacteroidota bacterium]
MKGWDAIFHIEVRAPSILHVSPAMRYPVLILILTVLFTPMRLSAQEGGNALRFDNSDFKTGGDFVYFPNHDYGIGDELTVAAWVYWDSSPNGPISNPHEPTENKWANLITLDYHDATDQGQFSLQHNSGNTKFEWGIRTSGTRNTIQSSTVPQEGRWYFLVGVYDGGPSQGTTSMRLYVNGVQESSANTSVISGNIKTHDGHMRLNFARISSDYRLFNGTIDAVRFWKRALTREEIRKQMHSSTTVNPADLVGYYNLNSSSGTSVLDSTGTLDGTFYTALVDVHSTGTKLCATIPFTHYTLSSPWQIADGDKDWSASNFANMPTRTVSGAGIDQTNTIVSNTCNTLTFQYGWAGSGADTIVTPILDGDPNDTWFGIENASQTSQWITSTAPVYDDWAFSATTSPVTVGASGADLQATITSTPDSSNNVIVYTNGTASDPAVTGESFPSGVTARGAVIWGNAVFGSVTLTLEFEYGSFPGIVDPTQVKLLQRATPTDSWTEVPSTGQTNNTTTMTFTLTGVSAGWQYAIGVDQWINPLPVELVLFQAHRKNDMVELYWKTHNEVNSFAFDI